MRCAVVGGSFIPQADGNSYANSRTRADTDASADKHGDRDRDEYTVADSDQHSHGDGYANPDVTAAVRPALSFGNRRMARFAAGLARDKAEVSELV